MKNYYYILGISQTSSYDEVKKAYRKLSMKFHPDKNDGDKFFEERFKEIQEAYDVLSNDHKRKNYDTLFTTFFSKQNSTFNFKNYEAQIRKEYEDMLQKEKEKLRNKEKELNSKEEQLKNKQKEYEDRQSKSNNVNEESNNHKTENLKGEKVASEHNQNIISVNTLLGIMIITVIILFSWITSLQSPINNDTNISKTKESNDTLTPKIDSLIINNEKERHLVENALNIIKSIYQLIPNPTQLSQKKIN